MMEKGKNSQQHYIALQQRLYQNLGISAEQLGELLALVKKELFIHGESPLFDAAYAVCRQKYEYPPNSHPGLWARNGSGSISPYDAEFLILNLARSISGALTQGDLASWTRYVCKNLYYDGNQHSALTGALDKISTWVVKAREECYLAMLNGECRTQREPARDRTIISSFMGDRNRDRRAQTAEAPKPEIVVDAERVRDQILREAEQQKELILQDAERRKEQILQAAARQKEESLRAAAEQKTTLLQDVEAQKEQILRRAQLHADRTEAEGRKRAAALTAEVLAQRYAQEQETLQESLSNLMQELQQVNNQVRAVEKNMIQSNTMKVSRQLLELYDLIADLRDTAREKALSDPEGEAETTAYNMDMLLMLVEDALLEYGISSIHTVGGQPFQGRLHAVKNRRDFDPRTAVVGSSLRSGFLWGDQVLRKEQITLSEEDT